MTHSNCVRAITIAPTPTMTCHNPFQHVSKTRTQQLTGSEALLGEGIGLGDVGEGLGGGKAGEGLIVVLGGALGNETGNVGGEAGLGDTVLLDGVGDGAGVRERQLIEHGFDGHGGNS